MICFLQVNLKVGNDSINKEISEILSLQQDLPIIFRFWFVRLVFVRFFKKFPPTYSAFKQYLGYSLICRCSLPLHVA